MPTTQNHAHEKSRQKTTSSSVSSSESTQTAQRSTTAPARQQRRTRARTTGRQTPRWLCCMRRRDLPPSRRHSPETCELLNRRLLNLGLNREFFNRRLRNLGPNRVGYETLDPLSPVVPIPDDPTPRTLHVVAGWNLYGHVVMRLRWRRQRRTGGGERRVGQVGGSRGGP